MKHQEMVSPKNPTVGNVPLPDHDEVWISIARLKNNKVAGADSLPAEL